MRSESFGLYYLPINPISRGYDNRMLQLFFIANTLFWVFNVELFGLKLGFNVVVLMLAGAAWIWEKKKIAISSAKVFLVLCIYILFSYFVAKTGPCNDKLLKLVLTAPSFLFLILVCLEVGWRASDNDWLKLQKTATWILLAAFVGFVIEALLPASFPSTAVYRSAGKLSGLFNEPSHVAFSLFPIVAILLVAESKQLRRNGILALCGLVVLSRSSTLIGLIVAWILYRLLVQRKIGRSLFVGVGLSFFVMLAAVVNYDRFVAPTLDRIVGVIAVDKTKNLSSLLYVQGWQDAWANLLRTKGLGLGFNLMGCKPLPDVPARAFIAKEYKLQLNAEDGSFLLSKIVSETGVIGILFFVFIIWWLIWIEKNIRTCNYSNGKEVSALSIQAALMFSFIATSLLRSAGYFNGGILLLVVAVAATVNRQQARISRET